MVAQGSAWPTKAMYDDAFKQWRQSLHDPDLRAGELAQDTIGIRRWGGANNYVCVYRIGNWMVRCFCSDPGKHREPPANIVPRYSAIAAFTQQHAGAVAAFLPLTLVLDGIKVDTRAAFPLVKMPFIEHAPSLGQFIEQERQHHATMHWLGDAWYQMIQQMEAVHFAHGDLDLTNVLVAGTGDQRRLRLIDYDNVWIPALAGKHDCEPGHMHFQHPMCFPEKRPPTRLYAEDMDRFAALVIYIAIRAIEQRPRLYDDWGADTLDRLIFVQEDYRAFDLDGGRLRALQKMCGRDLSSDLKPYIQELRTCIREQRQPASLTVIATLPTKTTNPVLSRVQPGAPVMDFGNKIVTGGPSDPAPPTHASSQPIITPALMQNPPPVATRVPSEPRPIVPTGANIYPLVAQAAQPRYAPAAPAARPPSQSRQSYVPPRRQRHPVAGFFNFIGLLIRTILILAIIAGVIAAAIYYGYPYLHYQLHLF